MAGYGNKKREKPPLNATTLRDLALFYVGRYATSKARLVRYLSRKITERGWDGDERADLAALAEDFEARGYVSDASYAQMRASGMAGRGYGARRIGQDLQANGIDEAIRSALLTHHPDEDEDIDATLTAIDHHAAALRFAKRKRIGPFANEPADVDLRRKQLGQMIRAGHDFALSRRLVDAAPGEDVVGE